MSDVDSLVSGWKRHFAAADRSIKWLEAEREASLWLDDRTLLLGIMDTIGETDGDIFFGEWKTANPREKKTWKQVWRLNPQSLTYGVLAQSLYPTCRRFTVRKAFKEIGAPSYDHAWFRYSPDELANWKRELLRVASEIREYRRMGVTPWPLNYTHCFQFGANYACPFFDPACAVGQHDAKPAGALVRISHLETERRLYGHVSEVPTSPSAGLARGGVTEVGSTSSGGQRNSVESSLVSHKDDAIGPERLGLNTHDGRTSHPLPSDLVVLDATRVKAWLGCRERYRREYEENVTMPPGEALRIGIQFHERLAGHYKILAGSGNAGAADILS